VSVHITIWHATGVDRNGPPEDTDPTEPYWAEVAVNGLTYGPDGPPWLRFSVSDADHPEGCSTSIPPAAGLALLDVLERWAHAEHPADDPLEGALDRWQRLARARFAGEVGAVTLLVVATTVAVTDGPSPVAWALALGAFASAALVVFWFRPRLAEALDDLGTEADRG